MRIYSRDIGKERRAEIMRNKDSSFQYRDDDEGGFLEKDMCQKDDPRTQIKVKRAPAETDF